MDLTHFFLRDDPLALELIDRADDWERITVSSAWAVALPHEAMADTLVLRADGTLSLDAEFLDQFVAEPFRALVTTGMVDLRQAIALGNAAWWIESLEACFFVAEGDDIDAILATWKQPSFQTLKHHPRDCLWTEHTQISADTAAALEARSQTNRFAAELDPSPLTVSRKQQAVFFKNVRMLYQILTQEMSREDVRNTLYADAYREVNPQPTTYPLEDRRRNPAWNPFAQKIWYMLKASASAEAVRAAIAACLRHNPQLARAVCLDLMAVGFPTHLTLTEEWQAVAWRFQTRWSSEELTFGPIPRHDVWDMLKIPTLELPQEEVMNAGVIPIEHSMSHALDLLTPRSHDTRLALVHRILRLQVAINGNFDKMHRAQALNFLMSWLNGAGENIAALDEDVRVEVCGLLVELDQGKLLRHFLPQGSTWNLPARTVNEANTITAMAPLPVGSNVSCRMRLSSALSREAIEGLKPFLDSMKRDGLRLTIEFQAVTTGATWSALANLVRGLPGVALMLRNSIAPAIPAAGVPAAGVPVATIPAADLLAFLESIQGVPLRSFGMHRIAGDETLIQPLANTIRQSNATVLTLLDGSEALASLALFQGRAFKRICISVTEAVVELFQSREVAAKELDLLLSDDANILKRNTSLVKFVHTTELVPDPTQHVISDIERAALKTLTVHNRLGPVALAAVGVGRGFGWSVGHTDAGGVLGRYLDPRSAAMLARTNKAAYLGWRSAFDGEVDRLAGLFDVPTEAAFNQHLVGQLSKLFEPFNDLHRIDSGRVVHGDRFVARSQAMLDFSVPQEVVIEAMLRKLAMAPASIEAMLPALGLLGAIDGKAWLEMWLDIDLTAPPTAPSLLRHL